MGRYLSWGANSLLFVLCCYLVASTANEVFAALLTPRADDSVDAAPIAARPNRSWSDREVILQRNLFKASMVEPAVPVAEVIEEDLEATQLPLTLLGTAAANRPENSWAAVQDGGTNQTVVVGVGHPVNAAIVRRIERRRVVLSEKGVLRELVLDEDAPRVASRTAPNNPRANRMSPRERRRAAARARAEQRQARSRTRTPRASIRREAVEEAASNPLNLLSEGQMQPKYEDSEMVGIEVNKVDVGSVLEEIGLQEGDVITQLNGVPIDEDQDPSSRLSAIATGGVHSVEVQRADGSVETLEFDAEE